MEASRPTADELDDLVERFRRDPATFVALGAAFLALGRPRDAIEIGARGLQAEPGHLDGRVMVARAFFQLHQWKEAQVELLKVVKTDRNHAAAFRLLGEVLMRRQDYERALPVLQHAQNLAPADGSILGLLKRARAGQPLEAPTPVPTPVAPRSGGQRPAPRDARSDDEAPTRSDGYPTDESDDGVLGRVGLERREVVREGARAPVDRGARRVDDRGRDKETRRPVEVHRPPPIEDPLAPLGNPGPIAAPPTATTTATTTATSYPSGVRPRLLPLEKPKDAAQSALRRSVAVGEDYLNQLLVGGLLDVPRVRLAEASYDVSADRRWGRSLVRVFVTLFALLFVALGGAGAWYWYTEQQRAEDVARLIEKAAGGVDTGDQQALIAADTAARAAIERDRSNPYAVAVLAQVTGLESFLYRDLPPAEVEKAIALAAKDVDQPTERGFRELAVARGAVALASLSPDDDGSDRRLGDARRALEGWLGAHGDDGLARWLSGEVLAAAGAPAAAAAAFAQAHADGKGSVLGTIALGQSLLDAGKYDEARALFDAALTRAPNQPWALIGRTLVRAERSIELEGAMADLNNVGSASGARIVGWRQLARATVDLGLEDYAGFAKALDLAIDVDEPRFLARVGLLRVVQGNVAAAAAARAKIRWYAEKPEPEPLVAMLDAELLLARGLPAAARDQVGAHAGVRAARLRGIALFDEGKATEALGELTSALAIAPDDLELKAWAEAARLIASPADRGKAGLALDSLGRQAKSKVVRLAHGLALARLGKTEQARERLEQSIADLSDEYPNPLAYRSHVALAELDLAAGEPAEAVLHATEALEQNPGYLPAHDVAGRAETDPAKARPHLAEVIRGDVATAAAELAYARAILPSDSPEAIAIATDAIRRAKQKGASAAALQTVAPLLPPELAAELGVAAPKKPSPPPRRRRR